RPGVEARTAEFDGGVAVADVGLQAVERLLVRGAVDDGHSRIHARGRGRAGDLCVRGERAANRDVAPAGDDERLLDRQVADVGGGGGVVIRGEERASVDADDRAGEIGVHVVVDGPAVTGGSRGKV